MPTPTQSARSPTPAPVPRQRAAPAPRRRAAPIPSVIPAGRGAFVQAAPPAVRLVPAPAAAGRSGLPPEVAQLVSAPGAGSPLGAETQQALENSLEVPLYPVRVHADERSAAVVNGLGARAFTYGLHIFLGSRESPTDLALMAHEVSHVVQQQGRPVLQMSFGVTASDTFEQEAQHTSAAVQRGEKAVVQGRTGSPRLQGVWPVNEAREWLEDRAWSLLNRYAPDLVPIVRQGPVEWLKEKITPAVETAVNTLMAPVRFITGLGGQLAAHFSNLVNWLREAAVRIAHGDCAVFAEAADKIRQVFEGIAAPIVDRIKAVAARVKEFFAGLWERFGAPVWNFLRRIGGWVWEKLSQFGNWVWEKTAPVRRALSRAWTWIKNKLGIGEGPEGQNGILQWIQRKAQYVWDEYIKPFIERYKRPLMILGGILVMLSPAGPIIAIGAVIGGVMYGIRWIRQNINTRDGVVQQRDILRNVVIPGILGAVNRVSAFLMEKAQSIRNTLTQVMGAFGQAVGSVAGTALAFMARGLEWLAERFSELLVWASDKLVSLANWVRDVLERLRVRLQPLLDFLRRVAAVVANVMRLPIEFGARIWNAIPACIRDKFVNFFIPLILRQVPLLNELASTPEVWAQTRTDVMQLVRNLFVNFDLWGALRSIFRLILRVLRIPIELLQQLWEKANRAWDAVISAPIRFIKNALGAILQGIGRFMRNILSHLAYGIQGWLFNMVQDRGITPPSSWTDIRVVFGFVLRVLGISLSHVFDLLERRLPRETVNILRRQTDRVIRFFTGVWEWVSVAINEGPAGLWRMAVERLSNLGTTILEAAVSWVMTRIIAIVGARLTALAASAGLSGILEAIYAVYQAIKTAAEYARRIIQVLITVFDAVIQIAAGVLDPAAQAVERGKRMAMPVVIGFLANYAGLGGIGNRIREIIDDVRERVDNAILWLIDRALATGRWILDRIRAGVQAITNWWRIPFGAAGESHELHAEQSQGRKLVMVSSEHPVSVDVFVQHFEDRLDDLPQNDTTLRQRAVNLIQGARRDAQRLQGMVNTTDAQNVMALENSRQTGSSLARKLRELLEFFGEHARPQGLPRGPMRMMVHVYVTDARPAVGPPAPPVTMIRYTRASRLGGGGLLPSPVDAPPGVRPELGGPPWTLEPSIDIEQERVSPRFREGPGRVSAPISRPLHPEAGSESQYRIEVRTWATSGTPSFASNTSHAEKHFYEWITNQGQSEWKTRVIRLEAYNEPFSPCTSCNSLLTGLLRPSHGFTNLRMAVLHWRTPFISDERRNRGALATTRSSMNALRGSGWILNPGPERIPD